MGAEGIEGIPTVATWTASPAQFELDQNSFGPDKKKSNMTEDIKVRYQVPYAYGEG